MKAIIKQASFYMVVMFLIGMTGQLVLAESSLYWTEITGQRIARSTLHGTLQEGVIRRRHNHTVSFMAADHASNTVCWTGTFSLNNRLRGTISCSNLDGTHTRVLLQSINSVIRFPHDIELDVPGGKMYWTEMGSPNPGIYRANLDGSFPEQLVDLMSLRNNYGRAPGQNMEYAQAFSLALDLQRGRMCWGDRFGKDIHCSDLNGGGITRVVVSTSGMHGITIDPVDGKIYWTTGGGGEIMRADQNGQNAASIVNANFGTKLDNPMDIATDSLHLYWTDEGAGIVYRSNMDGSDVIALHKLGFVRKRWGRANKNKFRALSVYGIALAIDTSVAPPTPPAPVIVTPPPAPPVAPPAPVVSAPTPTGTPSAPPRPSVTYRAKKGVWNVFAPASKTGTPVRYRIIVYDPLNPGPGKELVLLGGQSTNIALGAKVKGMTLASQSFPASGSLVAVAEVIGSKKRSAPLPVRMKK